MIETVTFEQSTFQPPPLRFEAGTPMIAEVVGLGAAIEYLEAHDHASYESDLIHYTLEAMQQIQGMTILGPLSGRSSLITFTVSGVHPLDVATFLDLKGIAVRSGHLCAQPLLHHFGLSSALRVSIAPYNTKEEVKAFVHELEKIVRMQLL